MATKQVKSVQAAGPGGCPCGRAFTSLLNGNPLPATLNVTFDDDSVLPMSIDWVFGDYRPWDYVGQTVKLRGVIVLPQKTGNDDYYNDGQVEASFTLTTTPKNGKLDPAVGAIDCFLNKPGEPVGS